MRTALTWLWVAGLVVLIESADACTYLGPRDAADMPTQSLLREGRPVYVGSVQGIKQDKHAYLLTIAVSEVVAGPERKVLQLQHTYVLHMCGVRPPEVGTTVLVAWSAIDKAERVLPVSPAYLALLRAERAKVQSNTTPHPDARDVPASASGSGARAGGRER